VARNIPAGIAAHLKRPATTVCGLLRLAPRREGVAIFGLTSLDRDVVYDDGNGEITYRAKRGYTPSDIDTKPDMSVDNGETSGLLAEYPADGVTAEGIARGDYDGARFVQYLVNYENLADGHVILNSGTVGQVKKIDDLLVSMELRSLSQTLKQNSVIELTSITCRAAFGDERCKMPLIWYDATVDTVGAESDRTFTLVDAPGFDVPPGGTGSDGDAGEVTGVPFFTGDGATLVAQLLDTAGAPVRSGFTVSAVYLDGVATADYTIDDAGLVTFGTAPADGAAATYDGTLTLRPDGYFAPGIVKWLTGANAGRESEIEEYVAATAQVTLVIPVYLPIKPNDTLQIRRDCDKSKAMCKDEYDNLPNMRAEAELPRANGIDLQSPTQSA
jgi:hypothetical protein